MKYLLIFSFALISLQCSHSAHQDLQASQEESGQEEPRGEEGYLSTPLAPGKLRFAIISDLNGSYGSTSYSSDVDRAVDFISNPSHQINFVISTGDMVAGQKSGLNYKAMWESFHKHVTRPLIKKQIPFFPSPGNHDAYISRQTERNHYRQTWAQEDILGKTSILEWVEGVKQNYPFQYAFKVGTALFIALDDTAAMNWSSETVDWIEQVLKQEKNAKLKIVYGHVPLLPFAFKKEREYVARGDVGFLDEIENLFETYKVDLFLTGHSHVYYPGRRQGHTQYVSVPLLGGGTRYLLQPSAQNRSKTGFLVIEYNSSGEWHLNHHLAKDYSLISDQSFPEEIRMPSKNSSLCKYCTQFPKTHFLDSSRRVIYRRQDL